MTGDWDEHWRMRIGEYRVIFQLRPLDSESDGERFHIYITHGDAY